MPSLKKRSNKKELLDQTDIPANDLVINLKELHTINKLLGGYNVSLKGIQTVVNNNPQVAYTIVDIGCGGGDTLKEIAEWGNKNLLHLNLIGIDFNPHIAQYAKENTKDYDNIEIIEQDYKEAIKSINKVDIVHTALFCHHLTDDEIIELLQWMNEYATLGFIINDLERHPIAYRAIKTLTKLFSKSYLVKNDAPLSVLRGFSRKDWKRYMEKSGVNMFLQWQWAFRYLVTRN